MPFFLGCLWRESWLLPMLLSVLASASRALKTRADVTSTRGTADPHPPALCPPHPPAHLPSGVVVRGGGQRVGHADGARGRRRGRLALDGGLVLAAVLVHRCDLRDGGEGKR